VGGGAHRPVRGPHRGAAHPPRGAAAGDAADRRGERIATGDYGTQIAVAGHNEVTVLAQTFNAMSAELRRAHDELTGWSGRLEERLQEKTAELGSTQRQVAHMDKMASLAAWPPPWPTS
jgi:methyl-accepting chemotaxis protein